MQFSYMVLTYTERGGVEVLRGVVSSHNKLLFIFIIHE